MTPANPAYWIDWLRSTALPLWSSAGYDAQGDSFVERLALDGTPQLDVPRRLMVQARQIHVFVTAARNGWYAGADDLALRAGEAMIARYCDAGGQPGWAFSCTRHGVIVDRRRDLYAHAFVLLALASLIRLDAAPRYIALVHRTLAFLDREMAHPVGGYIEQWPVAVLPRRQNPHMHLLEALLALQEGGACGDLGNRIAALISLFDGRFLSADDNVLSEYYDEGWIPVADGRRFEPGHHFEWIWLLSRYAFLTGNSVEDRIDKLLRPALRGIDAQGRVVDQMGPDGPEAPSCRLWPMMEAAKALTIPRARAIRPSGSEAMLQVAWQTFFARSVAGGWMDRVDEYGAGLVDHMPASSLYHVCTAVDFLCADMRCSSPD